MFFKDGCTAVQLHRCGTTKYETFCGQKALKYLKPAIRKETRGFLSKGVLLLYGKASAHSTADTAEVDSWNLNSSDTPHIARTNSVEKSHVCATTRNLALTKVCQ